MVNFPFKTTLLALTGLVWLLTTSLANNVAKPEVAPAQIQVYSIVDGAYHLSERVIRSATEWQQLLSPQQYKVLREQGTERAYTGALWNEHGYGVYRCAGCGLDLYHSDKKYDSGTGWPSFYEPVAEENIGIRADRSLFQVRNELVCARCDSHLGHVFGDGPPPTGKRHCLNSAALVFAELEQ